MAHLSTLMHGSTRTEFIAECGDLVEKVAASQSGISGMAIKGGLAAAKKADANVVPKALERILPDVLDALDPRWQDFVESGKEDFGAFLEPHQEEVSDEIMNIADKHVEKVNSAALRKPYNSLRDKATKILSPEVPAFGRVVQKHM